jgi:GNAT superfamily N-acetyltransferase
MQVAVHSWATDEADLAAFLAVTREVYRDDPHYSPASPDRVRAGIRRSAFADRQRVFLVTEKGRNVARAVARISPTVRDEEDRPLGMIGFFEALDHPQAVKVLFSAATAWLCTEGAGRRVGPMDGDTWHRYRLNAGPYQERPFLMEPYNPAYYPELWTSNSFEVLESYTTKRIERLGDLTAAFQPVHERVRNSGYTFRPIDRTRFQTELAVLHRLSCRIFSGNFLYTDIDRDDFIALYDSALRMLDEDLVWFGIAPDGEPVGFVFAIPDYFRAVASMRGRNSLAAKLRFLLHRRGVDTFNLKTIGVLPEHRRSGVGAALLCQVYRQAAAKGYRTANHCLMKEGNPSGDMDRELGRVTRRYHLYEYHG